MEQHLYIITGASRGMGMGMGMGLGLAMTEQLLSASDPHDLARADFGDVRE